MKKIMFAVMAMCAIGFTACGNKAQTAEAPADEVEAVVYNAEEEAAASINQLTEQIEAQDASKFNEVLTAIQEKIKDIIGSDPAVAKEYVTKIQDFLKLRLSLVRTRLYRPLWLLSPLHPLRPLSTV